MKIERMEVVGIDVHDIQKAARLFEDVLGIKFRHCRFGIDVMPESSATEAADPAAPDIKNIRLAIDPTGYLELIQTNSASAREGFRNLHFKVTDLEEAKAEMKAKGIRLIADSHIGGLREAIFHPEDLHGIRLCLVQYDANSMIDAIYQKPAG